MDNKSTNTSGSANKDFKNTPHVPDKNSADSTSKNATGSTMNKIDDVKSAISDKAAPAMDFVRNNFSNVSDRTQDYLQNAGSLVRQYPMYAMIGGLVVGALIGMAVARPSSQA